MNKRPETPDITAAETGGEGFLNRWSRLKQNPGEAEAPLEPASDRTDKTAGGDSGVDKEPDTEPKPLPPLETLDEHSDYSGFLSPEVDEELQRLAMRKLFHLPAFNVVDGLNDYDEDFSQFEPLGKLVTHEMRRLWQRERAAEQAGELERDVSAPEEEAQVAQAPQSTDPAPESGVATGDTSEECRPDDPEAAR